MVREWLKEGRENAVGRWFLHIATRQSDRVIRREIEEISETETPVLNMMDGKGYFIQSQAEADLVLQWIRVLNSYRRSLEKKIKVCEAWYAKNVGQIRLED